MAKTTAKKVKTSVDASAAKEATTVSAADEKKATEAKAAAAPKATAAKKTSTKTAAKAPAKAATLKTSLRVQYQDKDISVDDFIKTAKATWTKDTGKKLADLKSLDLYVKPEEDRVYYVANGDGFGSFPL